MFIKKSATKNSKLLKALSITIDVILLLAAVCALSVSGVLIYQKAYLTPFWVNGQSMYPTFNEKALDPNGNLIGKDGKGELPGSTMVDYGVMDCHKKALNKIERFDIVVTYYNEAKSKKMIKRVVGLPGETIKFTSTNSNDIHNGDLYVKQGDEFVFVQQPISDEYKSKVKQRAYPSGEITLGEKEYYVLGDNRDNSYDSRENGKINYDFLIGKVVALCAYCTLETNSDGELEPVNIDYYWPEFF